MTNCTGKRCPVQAGKVDPATCEAYQDCQWATKPISNADKIRAMTDEELAKTICWCPPPFKNCNNLCDICSAHDDDCGACWLNWLKQEVEE